MEVAMARKKKKKRRGKEKKKKEMEVHQEVIVECAKQVAKPPRSQAGYTGSPVIYIVGLKAKVSFT